jgi:hypothetical protein
MMRIVALLGLGLAALTAPPAAAQGGGPPAIYSIGKNITLDLPSCMARARQVLTTHGFRDISNGTWSTYGFMGNLTILVRCVPDNGLVMVVMAGAAYAECERLSNLVQRDS